MSQKRFEEYFAKVVLESCFPDKLVDLQISDKPDLRYKSEIGIEVTNCMPKRVAEAFNLWHRVAKQGEQTPPRIIERLNQLKEVQREENELVWEQGAYTDNIDDSPIKHFFDAVGKKVERLNSGNADYSEMRSYELFVNSFIFIPHYQVGEVIKRLQKLNSNKKRFDYIYLLTNEQKLLTFDMVGGILRIKYLYSHLNRMEDKAKQLYLGAKNG